MNNYSSTIESISQHFDEKTNKKLQSFLFSRLCKKLENESHYEIDQLLKNTFEFYKELSRNEEIKPKEYNKSLASLRKEVKRVYGFTAKGELKDQYTGMGIAIGVALGAPFTALNTAFIGIGIPIGLAIGVAIGQQKEKAAEEQGKTY